MKFNDIAKSVSGALAKASLQVKAHSPELFLVAGIGGAVVSAVMACKATTKLSTILDEGKMEVEKIHEASENEALAKDYTPEDAKKDILIVNTQTCVKVAKLYAPAVALGALSIASILTSNNIMRKRNVALAAACASVTESFKKYQGRVIDRFGEAVHQELLSGAKTKKIEEVIKDEETGKEKKVKKSVQVVDDICSPYACFFTHEESEAWDPTPDYNLMFLRAQQSYFNDLFTTQEYIFLNDVRKRIGMSPIPEGQMVGWLFDPGREEEIITTDSGETKKIKRDNYIDFGIKEVLREVDGRVEKVIALDFNVDGNIYELMKTKQHARKFLIK